MKAKLEAKRADYIIVFFRFLAAIILLVWKVFKYFSV